MTNEVRVKITNTTHLYAMAESSGLMVAVELLEAIPENLRGTPGMALALATLRAEANLRRGAIVGKNLALIARAGHNIADYQSVMFDPNNSELICEFYDSPG